ncbi:MAG TPA: cobalamin-binding protein [Rhodocyclaceae bacterium]|jgi:iron complex transport system substrate-binding protein|nr:cobalamin-binding protein [Rhodocyclaceae bacterium]
MKFLFALFALGVAGLAHADIVVRDDAGNDVHLAGPAQRIISLAPNLAELTYAAGAGEKLVGTVDFSDYPEAAKKVPRIGNYASFDIENIIAAKPDLVLVWQSGNAAASIEQMRKLKLPLLIVEPKGLDDIPRNLERIGMLAGTQTQANAAARDFRQRLTALQSRYPGRKPVRMFYEIWDKPLMTVNGQQIISDVMRLCGGENVFANLNSLAPIISVEAVLAANPDVIVTGGMGTRNASWLEPWKKWPQLKATARGNLFFIDPDLLQRETPRLLEGAEQLCKVLDQARQSN